LHLRQIARKRYVDPCHAITLAGIMLPVPHAAYFEKHGVAVRYVLGVTAAVVSGLPQPLLTLTWIAPAG